MTDEQNLHNLLQELHTELEHGDPVGSDDRELLLEVLADIRKALEQPPVGSSADHHSLIDRLRDTTWHLEESHPRLTSTAKQMVEALSCIFQ